MPRGLCQRQLLVMRPCPLACGDRDDENAIRLPIAADPEVASPDILEPAFLVEGAGTGILLPHAEPEGRPPKVGGHFVDARHEAPSGTATMPGLIDIEP